MADNNGGNRRDDRSNNTTTNNSNSNNQSNNNNNSTAKSSSRSSRGPRGLLRRYANVEHVIVEEPFRLYHHHQQHGGGGSSAAASHNNNNNNNNKAGDGCYVSATVQNRRYYGVLVDQAALKTASELFFQKQAESLDLNQRMKQLYQSQQQQQQAQQQSQAQQQQQQSQQQEKAITTYPDKDEQQSILHEKAFISPLEANGNNNDDNAINQDRNDKVSSYGNEDTDQHPPHSKRFKLEDDDDNNKIQSSSSSSPSPTAAAAAAPPQPPTKNPPTIPSRPVQKFKYMPSSSTTTTGYRILLATYADLAAAMEDHHHDTQTRRGIEQACQSGGNFVGDVYYQYESVSSTTLDHALAHSHHHSNNNNNDNDDDDVLRMSMGFETFLRETNLPKWYPLSNLEGGNQKVLSMLHMKRNHKGAIVWDPHHHHGATPDASLTMSATNITASATASSGTHVPMTPRSKYRIGILGGGIAGVACADEILRSCERDMMDVQVVLLEGRSRLGGRLWTDTMESFAATTSSDAIDKAIRTTTASLPIDLGASWIHGIDDNPLAAVAREAGTNFITVSDQVNMIGKGMQVIDQDCDERMGKIFDDILEQAADDCWAAEDAVTPLKRNQKAVRWYAAALLHSNVAHRAATTPPESDASLLIPVDVPEHRYSSDITIDHAIGVQVAKRRRGQFAKLTKEDQRVLLWNTKSLESTLGANVQDLSLKFWENDDRHAFEGDHVILKEGYSTVIQHMLENLKRKGDGFKCVLNFDVGKVEYARKSTTQPYADRSGKQRKFIELSDTCCVTSSQDESHSYMFDFVISTVPLGVLKESITTNTDASTEHRTISFHPPLPFSKVDSIRNVGFGLLNKLFLQFPTPFWRKHLEFGKEQAIFGNASGINPHHYMFFDVGKALVSDLHAPAILMTLVSGKDAVEAELKTDNEIVLSVMETLQSLFSQVQVPEPTAIRFTRWGSDKFSRGSHSFLAPGTTDQDFQMLQSPINGNGDSLLLDGSETMRLFFAGEHTTALHPSTAHGALLSGIRAGKEVVNTIKLNFNDEVHDRLIPLALFRKINPDASLRCNMCQLVGTRVREGTLLAFKRGARQVLAHNNCAENSPEVGVADGRWTHVIKAVNRGKVMTCTLCRKNGATIGCSFQSCFRVYHFSCGEDSGWRFDRDGKEFYCDLHRSHEEAEPNECDRISLAYCRSKVGGITLKCALCGQGEDCQRAGELLAFQRHQKQVLVHEKCAKYTNTVDTSEIESRIDHEFRNVFEAADNAKSCSSCGKDGATIGCAEPQCGTILHFGCAEGSGWDFEAKGANFKCDKHRGMVRRLRKHGTEEATSEQAGSIFQHALFALGQDAQKARPQSVEKPANADIGAVVPVMAAQSNVSSQSDDESSESDTASNDTDVMGLPVAAATSKSAMNASSTKFTRSSLDAAWNVTLSVSRPSASGSCEILFETNDGGNDGSVKGRVLSFNGVSLGVDGLTSFQDVVTIFQKETAVTVQFLNDDKEL